MSERRQEERVRLSWPVFFGWQEMGKLESGQIADLSCSTVRFKTQTPCHPGQHINTRFSYPLEDPDGEYHTCNYYHWSEVIRVRDLGYGYYEVAARLHQPLELGAMALRDETPQLAFA